MSADPVDIKNCIISEERKVMEEESSYLKGRGAQFNPRNRFLKNERVREHIEAIDDWTEPNVETVYLEDDQHRRTARR